MSSKLQNEIQRLQNELTEEVGKLRDDARENTRRLENQLQGARFALQEKNILLANVQHAMNNQTKMLSDETACREFLLNEEHDRGKIVDGWYEAVSNMQLLIANDQWVLYHKSVQNYKHADDRFSNVEKELQQTKQCLDHRERIIQIERHEMHRRSQISEEFFCSLRVGFR